jgi:hypothetical protein
LRRADVTLVACLHTAASNVAVLDLAAAPLGVALRHAVRDDLLARAEAAGGLTADITAATQVALASLAAAADVVLLTCSTLGPAAEGLHARVPVLRIDAALAQQAVAQGGKVVVLCAVETTLAPSQSLFARAAAATGATVSVELVPDAWAAFRADDTSRYHVLVAAAADRAFAAGADAVALAQASMAGAAALAKTRLPLTSPAAGLAAAIAAAKQRAPA